MPSFSTVYAAVKLDLSDQEERKLKQRISRIDGGRDGSRVGASFSQGFGKGARVGIAGAAKTMFGPVIAAAAAIGGITLFKGFIEDAAESAKIGRLTAQVIKTTGGAANITAKQVDKLAQSLSNQTAVDDELVQTGANLLLTFKNVRNEAGKGNDIFNQATAAALDLSAAGFGSVESASKMLGKALNDPLKGLTALGRAGVTFTAQQKEQIAALVEAGDVLGAQRIIMEEIASQVGGAAAAAASPMQRLKVVAENLGESVGTALLPFIERAATWLGDNLPRALDFAKVAFGALIGAFREGDVTSDGFIGVMERIGVIIRQVVLGVKALIAAFKEGDVTSGGFVGVMERVGVVLRTVFGFVRDSVIPVLADMWQNIKKNRDFFIPFIAALGAGFLALKAFMFIKTVIIAVKAFNAALAANPIGIVIVAIAALVAALIYAYKHSETFRKIVQAAWRGIREAASFAWNKVLKPVFERITSAGDRWSSRFRAVKDAINDAWVRIRNAARAAWNFLNRNVFGPIARGIDRIRSAWRALKSGFEAGIKAVPGIGTLFGGGRGGRASAFMGAAGRVFPLPPGTYRWGMGPAGHGYDAQDLPTPTGTPVRAPVSGFAQGIDLGNRSYGKYVRLASSQFGRVILAHLSRLFVGSGFVRAGQLVGLSGSTGNSTGPHLHVEPSAVLRFAKGGIIPEHVIGVGLRSGRGYEFGERGPEMVTPGTGRGGITVNVYTGVGDPKAIGREVVKAVGSYLVAGGRLPPRWHTA